MGPALHWSSDLPPAPTGDPGLARDWIERFLGQLGAKNVAHSGRSLEEHLLGTFDILRQWRCAPEVCIAGGLHSVLGTNAFPHACIDASHHHVLSLLVGGRVVRLVQLFHVAKRPRAILEGFTTGSLEDRRSGALVLVRREELKDLLAMECANLIEQGACLHLLRTIVALPPEQAISILPAEAVNDLASRLAGKEEPQVRARP